MRDPPKFSVVIPTYNRLELLKQTLDSVWAQSCTDYEVIVVDDGSSDGTHEWLIPQADNVKLIIQTNRGPGAARNVGSRHARGGYIAFLDSDDLWFPWTLKTFERAIQENHNPTILGGSYIEFTIEVEPGSVREESYQSLWFADYFASSRYSFSVGSGTCVINREAFASTEFLEDRLNAEDHDLILRMGCLPGFVQIIAPPTVAWRHHASNQTANLFQAVAGIRRILARETAGIYPGGVEREMDRKRILVRHAAPCALACLREGAVREGWDLYLATVVWNFKLRRWKYLFGFPVVVLQSWLAASIGMLASSVAPRKNSPT